MNPDFFVTGWEENLKYFFAVCLWLYFRFPDLILFRDEVFTFAAVHGSAGCGVSLLPASAPLIETWRSVPGFCVFLAVSFWYRGKETRLHLVYNVLAVFIEGVTVQKRRP